MATVRHAPSRRIAILLAITLVGAALRLWKVTEVPGGFNQDEAVAVYDAYSVLRTGRDHHGAWLPLNFQSFDDWIPPVHQYLLLPFVAVFGPTVMAARVFSAVIGTSVIISTYIIGLILFKSNIGLIASLFVALSSWGIGFSRVGHPVIVLVATSSIGIALFLISINIKLDTYTTNKNFSFFCCGLAFGLGIASYPVGKLSVPLLVLLIILIYSLQIYSKNNILRSNTTQKKSPYTIFNIILIMLGITIVSGPFMISQLFYWKIVNSRFESISALGAFYDIHKIFINYILHFDPRLLFWVGYRDGLLEFPAGFRQVPLVFAPFFYIGIMYLVRYIHHPESQLTLGWLLLFPLASSLTQPEVPHEVRAGPGHPVIELVAAIGLGWTFQGSVHAIRTRISIARRKMLTIINTFFMTTIIALNVTLGMHSLFFENQVNRSDQEFKFRRGISDAIIALDKWPKIKEIFVPKTYSTFFKILYLTHAKIEPLRNLTGDIPIIHANFPPLDYEFTEAWWIAELDRGATVGNWGRQILIMHPSGLPLWSVYALRQAIPEQIITLDGKPMENAELWYISVIIFGVTFATLAMVAKESQREGSHLGSVGHASNAHASSR